MTGITLHETTNSLDAGAIIHQTAASMVPGDGLHDVSCRAVKEFVENLAIKLVDLDFLNLPKGLEQKTTGKIFTTIDWRPEHLKVIYEYYGDRIVDMCINGDLVGRTPTLKSVI